MIIKHAKKIKFHIFRFYPTFDMLHLNVYLVQKCKKHLCCNLFWVPTQFDWTIWQDRTVCKQWLWQDCTDVQTVALARLHRCANSRSGKTAQVCRQWLWQDCTGVQTVALARLHRCADLAEPLSVIHVIAQDFDVLFVQSK